MGQDHVTQTLRNAIQTDRVAHALLFAGPRGVGKTSVARIMAKAMNCEKGPRPSPCNICRSCMEISKGMALDVFEIDGASNRGINEVRDLRENIKYMPSRSRFKIYIVDEVHMLTTEAFNALLKTLEEPPAHVLFFFATTEAHKIPITILSRCQRHNFKRVGHQDIVTRLDHVCKEFSFKIGEESLQLLAREAGGSMRDALSLLDHIMAYSEGEVNEAEVLDGLGAIDRKLIFDLSTALLAGNVVEALNSVDEAYNQGHDLKRLYTQVLEHFRHLLVVKMGEAGLSLVDVPEHEMTLIKQQVENTSLESVNQIFATLFEGETSIRFSPQPKLALETLFIKLGQFKPLVSFEEIISKLDNIARGVHKGYGWSGHNELVQTPRQQSLAISEAKELPKTGPGHCENLAQTWQQLLVAFNETCRSLVPNLEKAALTKIGKDSLEITVHGNSFNAARLRDQKSMTAIKKACSQFFKREMTIKVIETGRESSQNNNHKDTDKTRHLKKEALSHSVVTDALDVFQGRVVDVKIL